MTILNEQTKRNYKVELNGRVQERRIISATSEEEATDIAIEDISELKINGVIDEIFVEEMPNVKDKISE